MIKYLHILYFVNCEYFPEVSDQLELIISSVLFIKHTRRTQ